MKNYIISLMMMSLVLPISYSFRYYAPTLSIARNTKQISKWILASSRCASHSNSSIVLGIANNQNLSSISLSSQFAKAYEDKDTDGIQDLIAKNSFILVEHSAKDLILASLEATSYKPGDAASLMNGIIASCVNFGDMSQNQKQKALELIEIMENSEISVGVDVKPDIVSYCCAFAACSQSLQISEKIPQELNLNINNDAQKILDKLSHMAKKQAVKKRRKVINASKQKSKPNLNTINSFSTAFMRNPSEQYPEFQILYEDNNYIGICKPSTMICYHRHKTTKGKQKDLSLEDLLLKYLQVPSCTLSTLNPEGLGIVHRLDRGTSGCILLAKHDAAHALLLAAFFKREVKKSYLALIPAQIRSSHRQRSSNNKSNNNHLESIESILELKEGSTGMIDIPVFGKSASSSFTIEHMHGSPHTAMTVRMQTFTGRKHQVRIHCAEGLKRPLFLEPLYSASSNSPNLWQSKTKSKKKLSVISTEDSIQNMVPSSIQNVTTNIEQGYRFFLHAQSLQVSCLGIDFEAPLPQWWTEAINDL